MSENLESVLARGRAEIDILFVSSAGGHLAQLVSLDSWWRLHSRQWVTFEIPDAIAMLEGEEIVFAHHPTTRSVKNALRNLWLAARVFRRRRPTVVISTGAAVAVPFFIVAWILRVPRIFIEVYDRLDSATLTGRLCRPLSTEFCVQWESQLDVYPGATVIGPLL